MSCPEAFGNTNAVNDTAAVQGGVACLDGQCFGAEGRGYLRFSYANSLENILDAVERIRKVSTKWAVKV